MIAEHFVTIYYVWYYDCTSSLKNNLGSILIQSGGEGAVFVNPMQSVKCTVFWNNFKWFKCDTN